MRTVAKTVEADWVRIEPTSEPGIQVNGVPADIDHVKKADARVDLYGDAGRSFVVEHVLGPLGLSGVTAAEVVGTATDWDFARPEHRFCHSRGDGPERVVGHPAGLPNPAIAAGVADVGLEAIGSVTRRTIAESVSVSKGDGQVTLRPRSHGSGVRVDVRFRGQRIVVDVDPTGETDPAVVRAVTNSTTPFLTESPHEGIVHAVGDIVSDIPVLGGLHDLHIEAELSEAYHEVTVGATRKAHEKNLVIES